MSSAFATACRYVVHAATLDAWRNSRPYSILSSQRRCN